MRANGLRGVFAEPHSAPLRSRPAHQPRGVENRALRNTRAVFEVHSLQIIRCHFHVLQLTRGTSTRAIPSMTRPRRSDESSVGRRHYGPGATTQTPLASTAAPAQPARNKQHWIPCFLGTFRGYEPTHLCRQCNEALGALDEEMAHRSHEAGGPHG